MHRRGNQRASWVAKALFVLIVATAAAVLWLGVKGMNKEAGGPVKGTQALPTRAGRPALPPPIFPPPPPKQRE